MKIRYDSKQLQAAAAFIWMHNPSAQNWSTSIEDVRQKIYDTMIGSAQNDETIYASTGGYTVIYDRDDTDVVRCEILVDAAVGLKTDFVDAEIG